MIFQKKMFLEYKGFNINIKCQLCGYEDDLVIYQSAIYDITQKAVDLEQMFSYIEQFKGKLLLEHFTENMYFHEVSIYNYPLFDHLPYETILASKIVDIALSNDLDIVHAHYAIPHAYAAYMAQKMLREEDIYVPIVTTLHGTDITLVGKDASFAPVITFAINESNIVTAVSESLKQDTLAHDRDSLSEMFNRYSATDNGAQAE